MRNKILTLQFTIIKYFCIIGSLMTLFIAFFTDTTNYRLQLRTWYLLSLVFFCILFLISLRTKFLQKDRPPKTAYEYYYYSIFIVLFVLSLSFTIFHQQRVLSYWFQEPQTAIGILTEHKYIGPDEDNLEYIEFKIDSSDIVWKTAKTLYGNYSYNEIHFQSFKNREIMVNYYPKNNIVISVKSTEGKDSSLPNLYYLYRSNYMDALDSWQK